MPESENLVVRILQDLPNMPEEIVEQWLLPYAGDLGWPPTFEDWQSPGYRWKYILGDMSTLRVAVWSLEIRGLEFEDFGVGHRSAINGLIDAYVHGIKNSYWLGIGEGGRKRFRRCVQFVAKYGTMPKPPILLEKEDGLYICGGNHRVTALLAYESLRKGQPEIFTDEAAQVSSKHEIWVGRPKASL